MIFYNITYFRKYLQHLVGKLQQVSSPTEKFARLLYCILGKFQQRIPKSSAKITKCYTKVPSRYLRRYEVYMLRRYLRSLQQNYIKLHQVYNMQATFEGIILHILFNITTGHDFAYSSIYVWWQVEKHSNYLLCAEYNLDLQMNELSFPYKFQGLLTRLSSIHGSRNVVTLFALWTYAFRCIKILVNS